MLEIFLEVCDCDDTSICFGGENNINDWWLGKQSTSVSSTAGFPMKYLHTKNQFANKPKGPRQIRDHEQKALGKENLDLRGLFLCDTFLRPFF